MWGHDGVPKEAVGWDLHDLGTSEAGAAYRSSLVHPAHLTRGSTEPEGPSFFFLQSHLLPRGMDVDGCWML